MLDVFPFELVYGILYNLKGIDVLNLLSVNKRLYAINGDEKLWLDKLEYDYPNHIRYRFDGDTTSRNKYIYFATISPDKQQIISLVTRITIDSNLFPSMDLIDRYIFIPGGFVLTVFHDYTRLLSIRKMCKNNFEEKYIKESIPYSGLYSDDDRHLISKYYDSYVDLRYNAAMDFDKIELGSLKNYLQHIEHSKCFTKKLNEIRERLDTLSY